MHIFFSGIGGTAIGPLALIAKQAGYEVSGSDKRGSRYIDYLKNHGVDSVHIGQTAESIKTVHAHHPIDWYVYSSAVEKEDPNHPELVFVRDNDIKSSKRDALLNQIITDQQLKLVAIAGTHGKSTTTAMVIWLLKQLNLPLSYSVGAKISFGDMGQYSPDSEYFVYECDEFDRNFLAFHPYVSIITGVTWDHHEIFPTRNDYKQAFRDFITQSARVELWREDADYLELEPNEHHIVLDTNEPLIETITIDGHYNRLDAWLAVKAVCQLTQAPIDTVIAHMNRFPGLQRRMEQIIPNLYTDYAHTPEKIRGGMSVASEIARKHNQKLVVVYEPLTNRRQHFMKDDYQDCFTDADKVYWIPSYLAREDPHQEVLVPEELIQHLSNPEVAKAKERNDELRQIIQSHLAAGDMVVAMAGGGGDSLDEWVRDEFTT